MIENNQGPGIKIGVANKARVYLIAYYSFNS